MVIMSSLTLLGKQLPSEDHSSRRLLQNAVKASQRGAALTQRLLAFSRRQELKPESVDFVGLLSGMEELLRRAIGHDIELRTNFTSKLLGKGTGLGLSMVHGLAAQSGGLLRVSSELDKGTTVDLWLPAAKSDAVSLPRDRHTSIEAHSGVEALAKLGSGIEVDVVITDHAMPVMTGLRLLEAIKERYPELPVILATGYAELTAEPASLGVCKLTKPCSQQDIALAIHTALSQTPAGGGVAEAGDRRAK